MKILFTILSLIVLTTPNALYAQTFIFNDDFERTEIGPDWSLDSCGNPIQIVSGRLHIPSTTPSLPCEIPGVTRAMVNSPELTDVTIQFDWDGGPLIGYNNYTMIFARYKNPSNYYVVHIRKDSRPGRQDVTISLPGLVLAEVDVDLAPGRYEFSVIGNQLTFKNVDGSGTPCYLTGTDTVLTSGIVGFGTNEAPAVYIDSVSVMGYYANPDSLALVALYNATDGVNWTNNTNWLTTEPLENWYGVTVSGGRVTELILNNNNLTGTLPIEIGNLTNLQDLYLPNNSLTGTIPSELGNLSALWRLGLSSNNLTGPIPDEIGNLSNLQDLGLNGLDIAGNIPTFIYNFSLLGNLALVNCNLTGEISPDIGNLGNLATLWLGVNNLTGSIPDEIGNLNLLYFDIHNNNITGSIPPQIGNINSLLALNLANNDLTGSIPTEISNLTNLQQLILSYNNLTGSIPSEFGDLSNLINLQLTGNPLFGTIPSELGNLSNLRMLSLYSCGLAGDIPNTFTNLISIEFVYLGYNQFEGLPNLSSISSLLNLGVSHNKFTFEDIEPNVSIPTFIYSPQDSVGIKKDTTIIYGVDLTLSALVGGTANQYQWFKNSISISGVTNSTYTIISATLGDAGIYTCEITNTIAPGLTLNRKPITVVVQPVPELIAYYPFNGNANDESGHGLDGVVNGATLISDRFGNDSSAYSFDGDDDQINTPVSGIITDSITLCAWYKVRTYETDAALVTSRSFTGGNFYSGLAISNNPSGSNILVFNKSLTELVFSTDEKYRNTEWHFAVGTYDGAVMKLYGDGVLLADSLVTGPVEMVANYIIGLDDIPNQYRYFDGIIDEVRIYKRALSEQEILELYHEGGWGLTTWQADITVVDAGGLDASQVLTIGQDPTATDSLDTGLGEIELPPLPPSGIFEARFELPITPIIQSYCDFRNDTLEAIDWKLIFQGTYPIDICWNPDSLPYGTFYLVDGLGGLIVNVDMKTDSCVTITNSAISTLYIKYGKQNIVTVDVNAGWNIVSAPILKPDMHKDNYYPGNTSDAFAFYPDSGYKIRDSFELTRGYWLKFPNDTSYTMTGLNHRFRFDLESGWNMVGPFDFPVLVSNITSIPTGIIASNFFEYDEGYLIRDTLLAGKGYWVKGSADGKVILDPSILVKGEENEFASLMDQWGKIFIEDAASNRMTLYVTEDDYNVELPPLPPSGIFDTRFTTDRLVENITEESKQIKLSSASYPITIRVEGLNLNVNDIITGDIINEELNSGDRLVISDPNINILKISGDLTAGIPFSYELYQNYPNPFNPSTIIKFALPQDSKVNLTVFNILGEKVAKLINQEMKAGYHQIEFDASHYASGVYLYSITAGKFAETKKMILMK